MKRVYILVVLIFSLFAIFTFKSASFVSANAQTSFVEISTIDGLQNIEENRNYKLVNDIDATSVNSFQPIINFNGILDGNGHTVKNLNIETSDSAALIINSNGAVIKNLKFENMTVSSVASVDSKTIKSAFLISNATNTKINNVAIVSNTNENKKSLLTVNAKSSIYMGSLVGDANGGTRIENCYVNADLNTVANSNSKEIYVGGVVGSVENSQIYNVIANPNIVVNGIKESNSEISYCGGMFGFVKGTQTSIINMVFDGAMQIDESDFSINVGSFIGCLSCYNQMPENYNINYFYTSLTTEFIGNNEELNKAHQSGEIIFDVNLSVLESILKEELYLKEFYTNIANFDNKKNWDFDGVWQIEERVALPYLQVFSIFNYSLNSNLSFATLSKPNINEEVVYINTEKNQFKYGEEFYIYGNVTTSFDIDKFYTISGLRKDNTILFDNKNVTDVLQNPNVVVSTIDETQKLYTLNSNEVVEKDARINGYDFKIYNYNGGKIFWGNYQTQQNEDVHIYYLNDTNITNQGEYSFVLQQNKFKLTVATENSSYGYIMRSTPSSSIKNELIVDEIVYGQTLNYVASPTEDFAFNSWKINLKDEPLNSLATFTTVFDEKSFLEGGAFYGLKLGEDDLTLYATFTKNVCEITIKFAVNDEIIDDNLSKIYFDGLELALTDEKYIKKVKMGSTHTIKINVPAEHQIKDWYLSDGTNNLGVVALDETQIDLTTSSEDESLVLVINFSKEVDATKSNATLWWILGGVGGGLAIIGLTIFIIIKKKKNNLYKNYYY